LQAAYAAPLILLAQNRQEERERGTLAADRAQAARTQADAEFVARELAGIRLNLTDVVTQEDLARLQRRDDVLEAVRRLQETVEAALGHD
jgi:uncharacterized membrane protein